MAPTQMAAVVTCITEHMPPVPLIWSNSILNSQEHFA